MGKRGRIVVVGLTGLPLVAAAGLWARSYWRRDLVSWEADRPESRRAACGLYSSRGRVCFISHSQPTQEPAPPPKSMSWQSGDRASTGALSDLVSNQLEQAGVLHRNPLGLSYSQHVGEMSSATHVWTGVVVPWWVVTGLALAPPVYSIWWTRRKPRADADPPQAASPT